MHIAQFIVYLHSYINLIYIVVFITINMLTATNFKNIQDCILLTKADDYRGFRLKPVTPSRCSFQLSRESSERLPSP